MRTSARRRRAWHAAVWALAALALVIEPARVVVSAATNDHPASHPSIAGAAVTANVPQRIVATERDCVSTVGRATEAAGVPGPVLVHGAPAAAIESPAAPPRTSDRQPLILLLGLAALGSGGLLTALGFAGLVTIVRGLRLI